MPGSAAFCRRTPFEGRHELVRGYLGGRHPASGAPPPPPPFGVGFLLDLHTVTLGRREWRGAANSGTPEGKGEEEEAEVPVFCSRQEYGELASRCIAFSGKETKRKDDVVQAARREWEIWERGGHV